MHKNTQHIHRHIHIYIAYISIYTHADIHTHTHTHTHTCIHRQQVSVRYHTQISIAIIEMKKDGVLNNITYQQTLKSLVLHGLHQLLRNTEATLSFTVSRINFIKV
jgi:hypothetical protein